MIRWINPMSADFSASFMREPLFFKGYQGQGCAASACIGFGREGSLVPVTIVMVRENFRGLSVGFDFAEDGGRTGREGWSVPRVRFVRCV